MIRTTTFGLAPGWFWRGIHLAPKALSHRKPGAAAQDSEHPKSASAESAIHLAHQFNPPAGLKRAFSAYLHGDLNSWGDAPRFATANPSCVGVAANMLRLWR